MAEVGTQAMTAGNITIKNWLEFYRMTVDLLRELLKLIPEPTVANTMRSELEKGHVDVDIINESDKDALKDALRKQGMVENKDYIFGTYHSLDGTTYTALFYNISDRDKVRGEVSNIDPTGSAKKDAVEFFSEMKKRGINPDGTLDIQTFNQFCKNKGVNFSFDKNMSPEDLDYAKELISSEFNHLSEQQRENLSKKIVASGAINAVYALRTAGNIPKKELYNLSVSPETGKPQIFTIKDLTKEQSIAIDKRAEAYGLRISIDGPSDGKYAVSFAGKDQALMKRVFTEANYDLNGAAGNIYKSQMNFEERYTTQILNTVISNKFPDDSQIPMGSMLVGGIVEPMRSRDGSIIKDPETGQAIMGRQTLEISKNRVVLNAEAKEINPSARNVISQNNKDFSNTVCNLFADTKPTLLNPQEAAAYMRAESEKEKAIIIQKAQERGEHGIVKKPEITKEDLEVIKEHEKFRQLVEKKLQEANPSGEKMANYVYSISPYEMYIKDSIINQEVSHDEHEYFMKGDNFVNKAEMESSDIADALTGEQMAEIDRVVDELYEQQIAFDEMEDDTQEFAAVLQFDAIRVGSTERSNEIEQDAEFDMDDGAIDSAIDKEDLGNEW